ncbi:MAG: right-handed parallel beta-helix repeat-containing protein [Dehalococcoidia bacterium]|nr:right-handed parallel beta-helix repeat-containing protein [Dehalococcoidia bacterium]
MEELAVGRRPSRLRTAPVLVVLLLAGVAAVWYGFVSPDNGPGKEDSAPIAQVIPDVTIEPGQPIQTIVEATPAGSVFLLKAGVHRLQQIVPRDGDIFVGETGTILSGAQVLDGFTRDGALWFIDGQTQQGLMHGLCEAGYSACMFPEDLFVDGLLLRRVATRSELGAGRWYFDYAADRIYIADDPAGKLIETSIVPHAFGGPASGVTIRGLTIEKYAATAQLGAIQGQEGITGAPARGWLIESNEIRLNHGAGIYLGTEFTVRDNNVHHNGQLGLKGGGENSLIENNTISFNNTAGFSMPWEAGGGKFTGTINLTVRDNIVSQNMGIGLWTDIDNIHTVYEGNVVTDNLYNGIMHEISYDAKIYENTLSGNGIGFDTWMWGGQITLSNSRNVEIFENTVIVSQKGGDGITLVQANRGEGRYGPRVTRDNYIHHNSITYLGSVGQTGGAADYDPSTLFEGNNRFDWNQYHVPNASGAYWEWGAVRDWAGLRRLGMEVNGTLN